MALLAALVPPGVVIVILPEVPDAGGVTVTEVAETTVTFVPTVPLNETLVAPSKFVPVIVIDGPNAGVKLEIVGAETGTVNELDELTVLFRFVTDTSPVVAPTGTATVIEVSPLIEKDGAIIPLKLTFVAVVKLVPVKVILVPTFPEVGEKLFSVGATAAGGALIKQVLVLAARFC